MTSTRQEERHWEFGAGVFIRRGRLAQRESIGLTSRGSQVQILYRPPDAQGKSKNFAEILPFYF
jgi:hypothetical protein